MPLLTAASAFGLERKHEPGWYFSPPSAVAPVCDVMNDSTHMICSRSKYEHVTPPLHQLHWLKAPQQIDFKLVILFYKCVHGLTPACLADEPN